MNKSELIPTASTAPDADSLGENWVNMARIFQSGAHLVFIAAMGTLPAIVVSSSLKNSWQSDGLILFMAFFMITPIGIMQIMGAIIAFERHAELKKAIEALKTPVRDQS